MLPYFLNCAISLVCVCFGRGHKPFVTMNHSSKMLTACIIKRKMQMNRPLEKRQQKTRKISVFEKAMNRFRRIESSSRSMSSQSCRSCSGVELAKEASVVTLVKRRRETTLCCIREVRESQNKSKKQPNRPCIIYRNRAAAVRARL